MDSSKLSTKSFVSQWSVDTVVAWLRESNFGEFEKVFRDNEIDGNILLKLRESMVVRLFPTIKLEVQFLDLLDKLKQRYTNELNLKKTCPPSVCSSTPKTTFDNQNEPSSNSNSPTSIHAHQQSDRFQNSRNLPLNTSFKRETKILPNQNFNPHLNGNLNIDPNDNDNKHTFPHVYKLPQFPETLRLALASQDASAFKLRTYYRNLLISSIYEDLTRSYNLWYPNARQYKTVASALVKAYPFLETSTDGGESAWIDGIKGKFKRGRRTASSHIDATQSIRADNGYDRMSGDEDLNDDKIAQTSGGVKRSRLEFDADSDGEPYESNEIKLNSNGKFSINEDKDDIHNEELKRLKPLIRTMQQILAKTHDPDISIISDYFRRTHEIRRNFVKTHNTNEILAEYPALQLHLCLLTDFHMQTNIEIQTVLMHKIRSISKPIIRLAKETGCAPEILHSYHTIISQRPQFDQILADTLAILIISNYFGESQFLLLSSDKDTQSPWPIIRGDNPVRAFFDGKSSSSPLAFNIELDYVQLFHRPLTDFLTALCTLFATYTVFEITYGKLEMTLSFIDCLIRDSSHTSTARSPQVLELINELSSLK